MNDERLREEAGSSMSADVFEHSDPGASERPAAARSVLPGGGSWLRIMLALVTALTMVVLWTDPVIGAQVWMERILMAVVGLWVILRPGSGAPAVLLIGALVARVFLDHSVLDGSLIALVVLLPLGHQLAALSSVVPVRSDVQWAALLPTCLRYLGAVSATVLGLILSHLFGWW